jgi:hypothetical protein
MNFRSENRIHIRSYIQRSQDFFIVYKRIQQMYRIKV